MSIFIEDEYAEEEDTFGITVAFYDADNSAVTPNNPLQWTLTDGDGDTINNRENVSLTSATRVTIVLSGNDLQFLVGESTAVKRYILLSGTYDSSTLGSGVSLNKQIEFMLKDSKGIANDG